MALAPSLAWADSAVLILSGVPGSPEHEARFDRWVDSTEAAMVDTFGFDEANVMVLRDREARADDIRDAFVAVQDKVGEDDVFFLFFIGHGAFDGREYKFNIMGAGSDGFRLQHASFIAG